MKRKFIQLKIRTVIFLMTLVLGAYINVANAQQRLFTYVSHPLLTEEQQHYADAWLKLDWVASYDYVSLNTAAFKDNFINVNLPGNLIAEVEKSDLIEHESNISSWIGKINNPTGDAAFVVHGDMVTARISSLTYVYLLYPIKGGMHILLKCNGERMPQDESEEGYRDMLDKGINHAVQQTQEANRNDPETGNPVAESLVGACKVRILVAYTATANANMADPKAFVISCIDATNIAYNNSAVNFNVELAVSIMEVYTESLNSTTDKTRFHDTADGYMDDVHDYRTYFDADMCILITENLQSGICGEAYVVANSSYTEPFCVVTRGCAVGNLSFPHELGHLYGCRHDTYVDGTNTPYAYGHGYVYLAGAWRTVMAYNNFCTANGSSCTRLQYFSNPGVTYGGIAMGTAATNDNESALEASRTNISSLETTLADKFFYSSYIFDSGEQSDVVATNSVQNNSSTFVFNSGSVGTWRTGLYADMKPGFWAKSGSSFKAHIDGCTPLRLGSNTAPGALAVTQSLNSETVQVLPNPFSDKFDLVYNLAASGKVQIQLYNMMGEKVKDLFSQNLELAGPYQFTFDVVELPAGIYMCVVYTETGMKSIRIAKSK